MQIADLEAEAAQGHMTMSLFKVPVTITNPKHENVRSKPVDALVDTGSHLTWLPADLLKSIGVTPRRKQTFLTATRTPIQRDTGYAIVSAEGFETNDEVVFAEPGDMTLLGMHTLEGFGVYVDPVNQRLVERPFLVAPNRPNR